MWLIIIGFILSLLSVSIRAKIYETRNFPIDWKYWAILLICIVGNFIAFLGFIILASGPPNPKLDYSSVLIVLSLLAAGVIAGNFAFSYQEAAKDERFLPNAISICFMALFYFLFGTVSFYMGKSQHVHSAEWISILGPTIMFLILLANTLNNFWDYRQINE